MTRMRHVAAALAALALCAVACVEPADAQTKPPAKPNPFARPLTLDAQNIEGKAEGARVLFIHMAPSIALEDAPKFPSYLRDDFTKALSAPVRLVVRPYPPLVLTPASGGNR